MNNSEQDRMGALEGAVRAISIIPPDLNTEEFKEIWKENISDAVKLIHYPDDGKVDWIEYQAHTPQDKDKQPLYVIGCDVASTLSKAVISVMKDDRIIELVNSDHAKNILNQNNDVDKLLNLVVDDLNKHFELIGGPKPFKCKGKGHQYKEERVTDEHNITHVSYVCSCGKKLN